MAIQNLRWWIAGLLALATALNYLDRQSFPVVVGEVRKEILLSSYLLRHNFSLTAARKIALGIGASLLPASLFIVASPLAFAIVFFSIAMFAHQFWSANVQTLPADFFPARVVGSVEGLLGSAGSFGAMLFGMIVGMLVDQHGYGPAFLIAGVLHPLAFLLIFFAVKRIEPIDFTRPSGSGSEQ